MKTSSVIKIWYFYTLKKKKQTKISFLIISSKFFQNYFKIMQIKIFSKVSSKYSWNFHEISFKCLKNIQEIISKIKRIFLKFLLISFNTKNKQIVKNPLVHSDFFFWNFLNSPGNYFKISSNFSAMFSILP